MPSEGIPEVTGTPIHGTVEGSIWSMVIVISTGPDPDPETSVAFPQTRDRIASIELVRKPQPGFTTKRQEGGTPV